MAFGGDTSGNRNRAHGSPMSRRGFLQTGALCLVGLVSPLARCGGQTPGRGGGQKSAVREPQQALGASGAEGEKVGVRVDGGTAPGVLDAAQGATAAVVMVGGMAGGIEGPSGIYPKLAERFRDNGITALRLDYREPGDLSSCTDDLLAAVGALGRGGAKKVILVGWTFGRLSRYARAWQASSSWGSPRWRARPRGLRTSGSSPRRRACS